ncbi:hypothetical protein [Yersinia pestis]
MIRTEHSSSTQESGSTLHRHKRWEKLLHHPAICHLLVLLCYLS